MSSVDGSCNGDDFLVEDVLNKGLDGDDLLVEGFLDKELDGDKEPDGDDILELALIVLWTPMLEEGMYASE